MPQLRTDDITLNYEEVGSGDPVLLLHGLGSSLADWELQTPALAAEHRVITVDLRGHGRSDKPKGSFSVALFARDVVGLMDALELPRAHVVGISMGGMIAFQLAVDAPDRVKSLIAINATPELVPRSVKQWLQLRLRSLATNVLGLETLSTLIARRLFPFPSQSELRERFVRQWVLNDAPSYRKAMRMISGWSVADRLGEVRCPVLMIAAEHDYTPVAQKAAFLERMPTARLEVVADSRHATPFDQPERLNALLLEALRDTDPSIAANAR